MSRPSSSPFSLIALFAAIVATASPTTSNARANLPGGGDSGPPVTLAAKGAAITLANGIVSVNIDTVSATVTGIKYRGHQMVSQTGRHKTIYFSRDGGPDFETPSHCVYSVTTQTPDAVDISCKHTYMPSKDKHAWDVDIHFVLRRGASGLYVYAICSHNPAYPDLSLGEWRMVWSTPEDPHDFLERIYVDDARHWDIPSPADFATGEVQGIKEITKLTSGSWAGRYDCKYMYAANYWDLGCWGFASNRQNLGAWVVFGSHEFFNDGPTKSDLTAALGTTLVHLNLDHYGGSSFNVKAGESWQKFYGPWMVYLNDKKGGDASWEDAKKQALAEESAWPYAWISNPLFPLDKDRATVQGQLSIIDPQKPSVSAAGAWVGLASPNGKPSADWQSQGDGYEFWARADSDGHFVIPHVRPGAYTLFAFNSGAVGEYSKANITLEPGAKLNLGSIDWHVQHRGRIAWEIGIPDRSAAEFRHGNDYYLPLLFQTAANEFPNPLDYTIGKSDPAKDWLYEQSRYMQSDKPVPHKWRIHFTLAAAPATDCTLTLAFASAQRSRVEVTLNDEKKPLGTVTPPVQGGNALLREGIHAKYSVGYLAIPPGHLHAGENTISLVQPSVAGADSHIMYDYLNLEVP